MVTSYKRIFDKVKIPREIFDKYNINEEWFHMDSGTIHGTLHEYRVLVHAFIISSLEGADTEAVCYASIFHDIQRYNDWTNKDHGLRAANWVKNNFNHKKKKKIMYLINWHVPDDHEAPDMTLDLKCFKDADALDRWRVGGLDTKYLRTKAAKKLFDFSKDFYELTAKQKGKISDSKENILAALEKLGALQ